MIHGFRFSPTVAGQSPHRHILSLAPDPGCWKAMSWPRHLGFGRHRGEGLAIAFGWEARGTLWRAYDEAARAGRALATLLARIAALSPGRRVGVIAHCLGARVVLQALPHLDRPVLGRAVLLAAAEFRARAAGALATPAGRAAEFVNVTSRENDLFDLLIETLLPLTRDRTLGLGLPGRPANWLDLPLDHAPTLAALAGLGHRIAPPASARLPLERLSAPRRLRALPGAPARRARPRRPVRRAARGRRPASVAPCGAAAAPALALGAKGATLTGVRTGARDDRPDRALLLAHAERLENLHRAGGDGPALQPPPRQHRRGRAVRARLPEDRAEQPDARRSSIPTGPTANRSSIFECGAILQYLARKTGRFSGPTERDRIAVDQWLMWQMGGVGPMAGQAHHFLKYAPAMDPPNDLPYAKDRYRSEVARLYGVLDTPVGAT